MFKYFLYMCLDLPRFLHRQQVLLIANFDQVVERLHNRCLSLRNPLFMNLLGVLNELACFMVKHLPKKLRELNLFLES